MAAGRINVINMADFYVDTYLLTQKIKLYFILSCSVKNAILIFHILELSLYLYFQSFLVCPYFKALNYI